MSRRSDIERLLPINIKRELNEKLYCNGFSEYQKLSDWLKSLDYDISKSAIHRYAQKLPQTTDREEQELLVLFRQLDSNDRHALKRQAQMLLAIAQQEKKETEVATNQIAA